MSIYNPELKFYVYAYLRKTDLTPYYIGKGSGNRAWNRCKNHYPPKDLSRIIIMYDNISEQRAFDLEIFHIGYYGRKDIRTGILNNRTDGGEGKKNSKDSLETRLLKSKARKGDKNPMFGIRLTGDKNHMFGKKGISSPLYGRKYSTETRRKISEALKEKYKGEKSKLFKRPNIFVMKKIIATNSQGEDFIFNSTKEASIELNINHSAISKCLTRKNNHSKSKNTNEI
jgi:hypothetical protein